MAWANARVLESLRQPNVPAHALQIYAHILGAEHVWLARLEQRQPALSVWPSLTLDQCETVARDNVRGFRAYVERLTTEALQRTVHYRNSAGLEFDNGIEEILLHVAMHGSYHRGQVALLVRDAGAEPAPSDYIAFVRGVPAATSGPPPLRAPIHDR